MYMYISFQSFKKYMYVIETRFQKEFLKELLYHYQFTSNFNLNMAHLRVHKLKILLIKSLTIWSKY